MDYFLRKKGELYCESVSLAGLAEKYGTPLYIYSLKTFIRHFKVASEAFGGIAHSIFYSAKANSNLTLLEIIAQLGGGCDVVSLGEYLAARKAGIKRIIFSGVGKQKHEMKVALKRGLDFFGVESENELDAIEEVACELNRPAPVSLRINPDVDPRTHKYIATGMKEEKFGIPMRQALKMYREISRRKYLKAVGISMHLGSQIESVKPFVEGLLKLKQIFCRLSEQKIFLKHIDLGGGWAVPFARGQQLPGPADYVKAMVPHLKGIKAGFIVEPGRSLIGNAGVLVTEIVYLKRGYRKSFAIVDAGMNDFIRPALYGIAHRIEPVITKKRKTLRVDVVGPVCENADTFAKNVKLPPLEEGDLLCLFTAGAYGFSMSSNYNSRIKPAEVLVTGDNDYLIRERETYKDLWRNQPLAEIKNIL